MSGNLWSAKKLFVILSLAFALKACQTPAPEAGPENKELALVEKQKQLVRSALDEGKPEQALGALRPMLREFPNDPGLHNLMGLTQLALRNGTRAAKHFQTAYKLDQKVATGLNLSSALIENGEHENAVKLLNALLKKADKDEYQYKERIYHNLGLTYGLQKRNALAEKWYKEALEENPTYFPSHLELAKVYEKTKRPAMAMKEYRRSMDYCLVCFEPVQALSNLYIKNGRFADARKILMGYSRIEGVAPQDVARANKLLKIVTAGNFGPRKG